MNSIQSTDVQQHLFKDSRSAPNGDHDSHSILRSRTEEEGLRRRLEWQRKQQLLQLQQQFQKFLQQKILEHQRKCAQVLGYAEPKSLNHSQSKSRSKSPSQDQHKGRSLTSASKSGTLFEK